MLAVLNKGLRTQTHTCTHIHSPLQVASGKTETEVHSEVYVRQNMEKIKRLVKGYVEAKQGKGGG